MRTALWSMSFVLFAAAAPALAQGTWHYDPLDVGGVTIHSGFSFVLDDQGEGHLAYGTGEPFIRYCHWTEEGWDAVECISEDYFAQGGASIALDSQGMPHLAWSGNAASQYQLYCSAWNGSEWATDTVYIEASGLNHKQGFDLALTQDDAPRIAFFHLDSYETAAVVLAEKNGATWSCDTLAMSSWMIPANVLQYCSITLDAEDTPHLAFLQAASTSGPGELVYATRPSASWQLTTVDSTMDCGYSPSLSLTATGQPRIAYCRKYPSAYMPFYASLEGGTWTTGVVHPQGKFTSLALNGEDQPRIAFSTTLSDADAHLIHAAWNGSSWVFTTVDPATEISSSNNVRLALDGFDQSYIAYKRTDTSDFGFAWLNLPPRPFDLLGPVDGAYVTPTPTLTWEAADLRVDYDVWYAVDPDFDPHWEFTDIDATEFQFPSGYLSPGGTYYWKVLARDHHDGYETWSTAPGGGGGETYWTMHVYPTGIEGSGEAALGAPSLSASPNPSLGDAALSFQVPWNGPVALTVYDVSGREVERFEEGSLPAGPHVRTLEELPSGTYLCRLEACGSVTASRLVVLR